MIFYENTGFSAKKLVKKNVKMVAYIHNGYFASFFRHLNLKKGKNPKSTPVDNRINVYSSRYI